MPPNIKQLPTVLQGFEQTDVSVETFVEPQSSRRPRRQRQTSSRIGDDPQDGFFVNPKAAEPSAEATEQQTFEAIEKTEPVVHNQQIQRSLVQDPQAISTDDERPLSSVVKDAGEMANGIVAIEVWELQDGSLVRANGGWWSKPSAENETVRALCKDATTTATPGVDVVGTLWSNSGNANTMIGKCHHAMFWREIQALQDDPDTAKTGRLSLLLQAGFELASGIPFKSQGHQGLVVYYAPAGVEREALRNVANEDHLRQSAGVIGSTVAATHSANKTPSCANKEDVSVPSVGNDTKDRLPESSMDNSGYTEKTSEAEASCCSWLWHPTTL